ncbi:MAG: DUF502 domain-containing protein [Schleiferiaceae bacterium]|nr:DUF502 domain-containing protein [Schleiferiaceae bacterium]
MTKRLLNYFIQGLLYSAPIAITLYAVWSLLSMLDHIIPIDIPGLGLLALLILITLVGFLGEYALKLRIVKLVDGMLEGLPLVKLIYSSVKDVMKSLTGKKKGFQQPVLLRLSKNDEVRRVGFVTDQTLKDLGSPNNEFITVYVPHSLAISGQVFVVPNSYVEPLNAKSTDVMKYIISGGVTGS